VLDECCRQDSSLLKHATFGQEDARNKLKSNLTILKSNGDVLISASGRQECRLKNRPKSSPSRSHAQLKAVATSSRVVIRPKARRPPRRKRINVQEMHDAIACVNEYSDNKSASQTANIGKRGFQRGGVGKKKRKCILQ